MPSGSSAFGEQHQDLSLPAFALAGLVFVASDGNRVLALLRQAFQAGDPGESRFFHRYVRGGVELKIAEGVTAYAPVGRDAVGLALAELYQSDGKLDEAIDVVEQLEPTTYTAVSLAELYAQAGRYGDVVESTEGIGNEDDASALLLAFRGVAFREQGFHDAAHEAFKAALRSRSRDVAIRHYALFQRASNFEATGRKSQARKDLERILVADPGYPGLQERLAALSI